MARSAMKGAGFLVFAVVFAADAAGPKESFDIARFVRPRGWQRTQSPGLLSFQVSAARNGQLSSGQIFVLASEPSGGAPRENFEAAWSKLVVAPIGGIGGPQQLQTEQTPDGWTAITGTADYSREGAVFRAILINATGHERTMSMVAIVQGQGFLADVVAFFKELDLVVTPGQPAAASNPSPGVAMAESPPGSRGELPTPGGGDSIGNYVFAAPKGWTRTNYPDGVAYVSPPYPNTGEKCQLTIFPVRASSGDLLRDAIGAFQGLFKSDPMTRYPYPNPNIAKGTSPFGWDYLVLKKEIGGNGYYGETTTGVIVFVARVGSNVALIVGTSLRPLVSQCFGEAFPDQWPAFFHTLRFKNFREKVADEAMAARLLGPWSSYGGRALIQYTFAKGGRYSNGSAIGYTSRVSPSLIETTTYGFGGDGSWSIRGNTITLTEDKAKGSPEVGLFRLEQESDDGQSWKERLCVLTKAGDICYRREP
jgi:hypothetical protein